ncbi:MAG: ribosomal protein S10 [Saprospiraceae bacterium]|jgi:ribosomal protein S10
MLISNAFFVILSLTSFDTQSLTQLIDNIGESVTWTSPDRTETLTKDQAIDRLQDLITALGNVKVEVKHQSDWKNRKCYRVMQLTSNTDNYRIFYYCSLINGQEVVDKIKVSKL